MRQDVVDVAVAVVRDGAGRVLLAERTPRQVAAGFWELPGGKIDPGETAEAAAARELHEETGLVARAVRPLMRYEHSFPMKRVRLNIFEVAAWSGEPGGREGQRLAWEAAAAPAVAPILPSNHRVLLRLSLPERLAVVDCARAQAGPDCLDALARNLAGAWGILRAERLAPDQRVNLARRAVQVAAARGARLMLAGSPGEAQRAGAEGLHSSAMELRRLTSRPSFAIWSTACHDAEDLARAERLGADFAVVSPVLACGGASARAPLGWSGLRKLAAATSLPIYARGGVGEADLGAAKAAGARGVAATAS